MFWFCQCLAWSYILGLNRMQSPQNVRTEMRNILNHVQSRVGGWVGLSVIHLGYGCSLV
jgi:hypothetical protein